MPGDHNLAIARAARAILRPIGCVQKGRSRIWLDDRGWWVGVIEFQPSGFSRMSYLNVGACFLWVPKNFYSFDDGPDEVGSRRPESASVDDDPEFERSSIMLAEAARAAVMRLRARHADVQSTARALRAPGAAEPWGVFHSAIASGLAGDLEAAAKGLRRIAAREARWDWEQALSARAGSLLQATADERRFRTLVRERVAESRSLLRLPERVIDFSPS